MPLDSAQPAVTRPHTPAGPHRAGAADTPAITVRPFESIEDAEACVALQRDVWGATFADHVPASLVRVLLSIGGIGLGAFAADGAMLGFVFGFAGMLDGEPIHWSHMLAVRKSAEGRGIGRALKERQRDELARRGVRRMRWTFDPLQARNAHLNLNRLGVRVVEYVTNMYGITGSPLHHGLATDRLIVECHTDTPARPTAPVTGTAPILTPHPRAGDRSFDRERERPPMVWIEIPADLQQVLAQNRESAPLWRSATREHFRWALDHGYRIDRLHRDVAAGRAFYVGELAAPAHA